MMKKGKEKNISKFNEDVLKLGGYAYTNENIYSARVASEKQSAGIIKAVKSQKLKRPVKILDVGSGDGTYTFELYKHLKPDLIVGFDYAKEGVEIAKKMTKKTDRSKIKFQTVSIYDADKKIEGKFGVVVIRGVLHHLYNPRRGIKAICKLSNIIVVAEPNGFSPLMKIMEKASLYHRQHEEKSYWPPTLNSWFEENGFTVQKQEFFGIVPFFFPETLSRLIKRIEPFLEAIPYVNRVYCGTNLIVYEKRS